MNQQVLSTVYIAGGWLSFIVALAIVLPIVIVRSDSEDPFNDAIGNGLFAFLFCAFAGFVWPVAIPAGAVLGTMWLRRTWKAEGGIIPKQSPPIDRQAEAVAQMRRSGMHINGEQPDGSITPGAIRGSNGAVRMINSYSARQVEVRTDGSIIDVH